MIEEQEELHRQLRRLEAEEEKERYRADHLKHIEEEQEELLFGQKQMLEVELETWSGGEPFPFDIMEEKKEILSTIQYEIRGFLEELEQEKRHVMAVKEEKRDEIYHRLRQLSQ